MTARHGRRLAAIGVGGCVVLGLIVVATRGDDGSLPPPRSPQQVRADLGEPRVGEGFAGVVEIEQSLLPRSFVRSAALPETTIRGRFWVVARDRWRLEIQGTGQDWQVVRDGATISAYNSASQQRYTIAAEQLPDGIADIGPTGIVGAEPVRVAGRAAHRVSYRPQGDDLLIGRIDVSADAQTGIPLDVALWARGAASPAVRIRVTTAGVTRVPAERVRLDPPATATDVPLGTLLGLAQRSGRVRTVGSGWERIFVLDGIGSLGPLVGSDSDGAAGPVSVESPLVTVLATPGARAKTRVGSLPADVIRRRAR